MKGENMTLTKGSKYNLFRLEFMGWTAGDGTGVMGYNMWDYFDDDGTYRGPDEHGIEPTFLDDRALIPVNPTLDNP